MKLNLTDKQVIELLGGATKVAKLCQISVPAVSQWQNNGIPHTQMVFLGAELEKQSHGLITRKDLFPQSWHLIWPELLPKLQD